MIMIKRKTARKWLLITFIFIIFLYLIWFMANSCIHPTFTNVNESFDNSAKVNEWVVLLTTCVEPFNAKEDEIKYRTKLYKTQIQKWLNETKLPIFVVESSNNTDIFKELNDPDNKVTYYTLLANDTTSSSIGELKSLKYALENMKKNERYIKSKYILKVTGRYFLNDIENAINKLQKGQDLYLQKHRTTDSQNSEYYGIKKDLFDEFINSYDKELSMENNLYNFSLNKKIDFFEPFNNDIPRGGDKITIQQL